MCNRRLAPFIPLVASPFAWHAHAPAPFNLLLVLRMSTILTLFFLLIVSVPSSLCAVCGFPLVAASVVTSGALFHFKQQPFLSRGSSSSFFAFWVPVASFTLPLDRIPLRHAQAAVDILIAALLPVVPVIAFLGVYITGMLVSFRDSVIIPRFLFFLSQCGGEIIDPIPRSPFRFNIDVLPKNGDPPVLFPFLLRAVVSFSLRERFLFPSITS